MSRLKFRKATEKDFGRIKEITMKSWLFSYDYLPKKELMKLINKYYSEKSLKNSLQKVKTGTDLFIVAESGKKIIGLCHATAKDSKGEILKLYLDTNYIGKGIGKKLLVRSEEFLKEKGCETYFTFVNLHNKIGLDFYLRNSFKHVKEKDKEDEFKNGKVLWYMEKEL